MKEGGGCVFDVARVESHLWVAFLDDGVDFFHLEYGLLR